MAAHQEFGKQGEQLAAEWLLRQGFELICRNWRHRRYEIDILACREGVLHVIEVKARHDDLFGNPEDWVDRKKGNHLLSAGEAFREQHPRWTLIQYDILSILIREKHEPEFFFIEDVYWW